MQCDSKQEYCYCVDTITGVEIPRTRKRKERNQRIRCDNTGEWKPIKRMSGGHILDEFTVIIKNIILCRKFLLEVLILDFSLDAAPLPTTEALPSEPQERYPVGKESCKLDRNRGHSCNGTKPSLRVRTTPLLIFIATAN